MDKNVNTNDVLIISYNFGPLDLQIHTFSGIEERKKKLILFNEDCWAPSRTQTTDVDSITNTENKIFRVGYILG